MPKTVKQNKKSARAAIKKVYPGISDMALNGLMVNLGIEGNFQDKNLREGKYAYDDIRAKKDGDWKTMNKNLVSWAKKNNYGETKDGKFIIDEKKAKKAFNKLSKKQRLGVQYQGDQTAKYAGGYGALQFTARGGAYGNYDFEGKVKEVMKEMDYKGTYDSFLRKMSSDYAFGSEVTLRLKKNEGMTEEKLNKSATAKNIRKDFINPGETWDDNERNETKAAEFGQDKDSIKAIQQAMVDAGVKDEDGNEIVVDGDWGDNSEYAFEQFSTNETYALDFKEYQRKTKSEEEGDILATTEGDEDVEYGPDNPHPMQGMKNTSGDKVIDAYGNYVDIEKEEAEEEEKDVQVRVTTPEKKDPITGEITQEETTSEFAEYGDYSTRVYDNETEQQYLVSVDFEEDEFGNVTQKVQVFDADGKNITDTEKELVKNLTEEVVNKSLSGENKFQKEGDEFYSTTTGDLREDRGRFVIQDQPLVTYDPTREVDNPDFDPEKPEGPNNRKKIVKDAYIVKEDLPENKKEIVNKTVEEKTKERLRAEQQQEIESTKKLRKEAEIDTPGREHLGKLKKELEDLQKKQNAYAEGSSSYNELQAEIDRKQKEVEKANADVLKIEHEQKLALAVGNEKSARDKLAKIQKDLEEDPNSHTQEEVDRAKQEVDVAVKNVYDLTDNPSVDLPFDTDPAVIQQIEQEQEEVEVEGETVIVKPAEEEDKQEVVVQPEVTVTADTDEDTGEKYTDPGWFKGIGGVSTLVAGVLGGVGLAQALKKPKSKDMPKLSEAFEEHLRQSKQLADQGFSPMEEAKIRRDIDGAYKTGMDNIVRGSAGNRAKFLAMSGVLDVNRSTALLDFAAKDAQAAREGRKEYGELLKYKESFEAQKSLAVRSEDLQIQLENKKAGAELAKSAFSEIMDNVNNSRLNNLRETYMERLINDMSSDDYKGNKHLDSVTGCSSGLCPSVDE